MSNAVAVAAVTETFSRVVESAAQAAVPGATLSNAPPEAPPTTNPTRVSLYLYRVSENPGFRADDLPTRNGGGTVLTKPQIALNLDYLVSFYGLSEQLERERMLGRVMSTLHSRPLLSPEAIQSAIDNQLNSDPTHFLGESDLPQQIERVRITPTELNLEEMSKLWSVFFQEPYSLSVAYTASVVLIEGDETPQEGLPVQVRQVRAVPVAAPYIASVSPAAVAYSTTEAALLTLTGSALAADRVIVRFGEMTGAPQLVTNNRIVVPVPPTLSAGVRIVHVAHMVDWGTPSVPDLRPIVESNRVAFALQPEIASASANVSLPGPLAVTVNPELQVGQRARLVLREVADPAGAAPRSFEVELTVEAIGRDLSFDLTDAPTGEFWLRVSVDDVTSSLDFDGTGFTGPTVVIT